MHRGVTLIELLVTIAIVSVVAFTTTPFVSSFIIRTNYGTTTDNIVSTIRKAQGYAMDGVLGGPWGVCLVGSSIRLFRSSCTTPTVAEDFVIPSGVTVSGVTTTTFTLRGEPNPASGLSSISITSSLGSKTVEVYTGGGIHVQ